MRTGLLLLVATIAASPAVGAQRPPTPQPTPAALALFERDWVLMNWALKYHDADGDSGLSPAEGAAAAAAFRDMADKDHDGRVTPEEYRAAREAILARY
jgi:hypothetical protein